jgi:glutamate/tyrosine decarboxylase-like PLP-dependent enzyme
MTSKKASLPEETLDPEDWEAMRALGHRMLDDMLDYLQTIRQRPVWQHAPEPIKAHFRTSLPLEPEPPEAIYAEFQENILPYPVGNIHPRFWGWVFGTGTVLGAMADLLAAAMNTNSGDLAQLIETSPELELVAPVALNVVCFRYVRPELDDAALDALNKAILIELQEQGIAVLSGTIIRGKYVLRVGHTNHRSRHEDFDVLAGEVIRIGREMAQRNGKA